MARIAPLSPARTGWVAHFVFWLARRRVGRVPEPLAIQARHSWIFRGYGAYEYALERSRRVDPKLKALASLKAATLVGCPF